MKVICESFFSNQLQYCRVREQLKARNVASLMQSVNLCEYLIHWLDILMLCPVAQDSINAFIWTVLNHSIRFFIQILLPCLIKCISQYCRIDAAENAFFWFHAMSHSCRHSWFYFCWSFYINVNMCYKFIL